MGQQGYIIYIDTGGTFTDAVVVVPDGTFVIGKASTTPDKLDVGLFNSIEYAAGNVRLKLNLKTNRICFHRLKSNSIKFVFFDTVRTGNNFYRLPAFSIARKRSTPVVVSSVPPSHSLKLLCACCAMCRQGLRHHQELLRVCSLILC
jgi:hypothetical protein